jgi:hypothetical protein
MYLQSDYLLQNMRTAMKWTKYFLPLLVILPTVAAFAVTESKKSTDLRRLQIPVQTLNYRANYSADFTYFRDTLCIGDSPVLQVSCFGKNMTILGTSDSTILCSQITIPLVTNGTSYECQNTCSGTACETVYLANNGAFNPFGSIQFICEGDDLEQVEAEFIYLGGSNGTCAASTASTRGNNYHNGRLGVSCPIGTSREYSFDDTYFECFGISYAFDVAIEPGDSDIYTCYSGNRCNGLQCTVPFSNIYVRAIVPSFYDSCIEAIVPITTFPTPAPASSAFEFSAQFEALWSVQYDSTASRSGCTSANPAVLVACENGASIEYINSTDSSMNCTEISGSELECIGDINSILDNFTSVFYVSAHCILVSSHIRISPASNARK